MSRSHIRLTKRLIDQAQPEADEYVLHDSDVRGFGCKVTPTGKKVYVLFYRTRDGRQRRPTIGQHGVVTVDQARDIAREWLAEVIRGGDPSQDRQDRRKAATMADLGDRYMREYAWVHKKPSSAKQDERLIENRIKPALGRDKVAAVTRADILDVHHGMRATPYEANRALALLSKMFNLAEAWGLRPDGSNPVRHVRRYAEQKRERFLSDAEMKRLGEALAQIEENGTEQATVLAAIRLLALTGCRLGEVIGLKWDWIDMAAGIIHLPDAKAGARKVALSDAALGVLRSLPSGGAWVLPRQAGDGHLPKFTLEHAWARIRKLAEMDDVRLHDFRHTVGTYGGQAGFNAFIIRDLLGHKTLAMTGRYVERDHNPMRTAANIVGERVAASLGLGGSDPGSESAAQAAE